MQSRIHTTIEKIGGISPRLHWYGMLGIFFVALGVVAVFGVFTLSRVSVREDTATSLSSSSKMNTEKLRSQVLYYEQKKKEFEEMEKSLGTR